MMDTLALAKELISRASITPDDAGCQKIIAIALDKLGFQCEHMPFGDVNNLWAKIGNAAPLVVFAGHTDVVPPGPESAWKHSPFNATVEDGLLYGRGSQDMKCALAAMISACDDFLSQHKNFKGSIGFLITSDEEGEALNGTQKVIDTLIKRGEKIDYCIIGEASSNKQLGDRIRIGRRGSLHGRAIIQGKQGHIANPELAINPIHLAMPVFTVLTKTEWDRGNQDFPPTTFQISNIHSGTGVANMIPNQLEILFNWRFSPESTIDSIKQKTLDIIELYKLPIQIEWSIGGEPFYSKCGKLTQACKEVIQEELGIDTEYSTGGGTSDGRFIAKTGAEIVELGFCNDTAHQINERIPAKDLEKLKRLYTEILKKIF